MSFQAALGDAAKVSEACIADALKGRAALSRSQ